MPGMRVLITGAAGFAGSHLAELAEREGAEVVAPSREDLDLTETLDTCEAFEAAQPDRVFHLAADASVSESWQSPAETLRNNTESTLSVLEAVRTVLPGVPVLIAGSGEIYGPPERIPVDEGHPFRPQNPYALSKAAGDLMAGFYADAHGVHAVRTRSFNHAGPRQADIYVVAAFARQIAEAEASGTDRAEIVTGELAARRDFTDVRDVVRAYWLLAERAEPGAYNVCSGESTEIRSILAALGREARLEVEQRTDPSRLRANDVMDITGSHDKLTQATGWQPEIPLEQTLRDTLDWWRSQVTA